MLDLINKADADKLLGDITTSIEMQNYSEAMRLTNEALSINPKDANLYFYKGIIYSSMNDYYLATAPFYKALELDKNNAETYYYLAVCFDNLSEFENDFLRIFASLRCDGERSSHGTLCESDTCKKCKVFFSPNLISVFTTFTL